MPGIATLLRPHPASTIKKLLLVLVVFTFIMCRVFYESLRTLVRLKVCKIEGKKAGSGPVMVSDILCPDVHIWGTGNVYSLTKGLFLILKLMHGRRPKEDDVL